MRDRWVRKPLLSHACHYWLTESGSLTARLQSHYADFMVKPVRVASARAAPEEAKILHINSREYTQIREVLLSGDSQPLVFAHSVLPYKSLRGEWRALGRLGNKPLGAVLFANIKVRRTPLAYKKLTGNHVLYRAAVKHLVQKPEYLWARRSIFSLNCASIMVVEVFLPNIF